MTYKRAVLTDLLSHVCKAFTALAAYFLSDLKPNLFIFVSNRKSSSSFSSRQRTNESWRCLRWQFKKRERGSGHFPERAIEEDAKLRILKDCQLNSTFLTPDICKMPRNTMKS